MLRRPGNREFHGVGAYRVAEAPVAADQRAARSLLQNLGMRGGHNRPLLYLLHVAAQVPHAVRVHAAQVGAHQVGGDSVGVVLVGARRQQHAPHQGVQIGFSLVDHLAAA